jgi:hypothetical protein
LVDKTDTLNRHAFQFKRKARQVKREMWWRSARLVVFDGFFGVFDRKIGVFGSKNGVFELKNGCFKGV